MSHHRQHPVIESHDELHRIQEEVKAKPELARRLEFIVAISEHPDLTLPEVAGNLGLSRRTAQRWWHMYLSDGIGGFLHRDGRHESGKRSDLMDHEFERMMSCRLEDFLATLPMTFDIREWVSTMKGKLIALLDDADDVSVAVNITVDLLRKSNARVGTAVLDHGPVGNERAGHARLSVAAKGPQAKGTLLEERSKVYGPYSDIYQDPVEIRISLKPALWIGTFFLWRRNGLSPISERTIDWVRTRNQIFAFIISDAILRHQHLHPEAREYRSFISRIADDHGLSNREYDVLLRKHLGWDHDQIAASLNVTKDTVKKHMISILAKTEARTAQELFARYLVTSGIGREREADGDDIGKGVRRRKK